MAQSQLGRPEANGIRLRRPLPARLFGSGPQAVLTLIAALFVVTVVAVAAAGDPSLWPLLLVQVVLVGLWLRAFTGWARVDDDGLTWRYWARWEHNWPKISAVTLTRRANTMSYRAAGPPIILVRVKGGDEDYVVPARACGRHRRAFGTAVLAAAKAHGVRTEVTSTGWNEKPGKIAEPWE
jgi:hypothetical protein